MMDHGLEGRTVVVTGGSGFLGSHLCRALSGLGCEVHSISRTGRPAAEGIHHWGADLAELAQAREIIGTIRPQVIFHLASHVEGSRNLSLVNATLRNNLVTTVNLLTAAAETNCGRFLLAGSLEEPEGEDGSLVPCSPYAASKWAAAAYARMFHKLYGVPVVLLRVFMVYGPGQQDERKLVPYVIRSFLSGDVPKLSSGQRLVDWIYVEDVAEGMLASAEASNVEGKTVDIGSGELVSVHDVATTLSRLMESPAGPRFGAIEDRPFEQVRRADLAKTGLLTGWAPRTSLENGLRQTIAWYKQQRAMEQSGPRSEPFLVREEPA